MSSHYELRLARHAKPTSAAPLRRALLAFLTALDVREEARVDIVTAVGEALANAIEHAYVAGETGEVELSARMDPRAHVLAVDVIDRGRFIERKQPQAERGFGLRIVKTVARSMTIDTANGTSIRMVFDAPV